MNDGKDTADWLPGPEAIKDDFIPAASYTSPALIELEKEKLWQKIWHLVCREQELSEKGDYVVYDLFEETVAVVRTNAGADDIKAYYNVCAHRGRKLRNDERGNLNGAFYCPYHGWRYSADDGRLISLPQAHDWEGYENPLDGSCDLEQVRVARWGGFVWINMDRDAAPLEEHLGTVRDILEPFQFDMCRITWHKSLIAPVSWKVMMEAFMEGYHSGATHRLGVDYANLSSPSRVFGQHSGFYSVNLANPRRRDSSGGWVEMTDLREQLAHAAKFLNETLHAMYLEPGVAAAERLMTDVSPGAPQEEVLDKYVTFHRQELEKRGVQWPEGLTRETIFSTPTDVHIFPNVIILPTVDGALCYRTRPLEDDASACRFDVWCLGRYAPAKEPMLNHQIYDLESFRGQNPFLEEDFANLVAVNKGMKSRGWRGARTNPSQETTISNFHRVLHQFLQA